MTRLSANRQNEGQSRAQISNLDRFDDADDDDYDRRGSQPEPPKSRVRPPTGVDLSHSV